MAQTSFTVSDGPTLTTTLASISLGGGNDQQNTAYTITLAAAIALATGVLDLDTGSSLTFAGPYLLLMPTLDVTGAVTTDLNFKGAVTLNNGTLDNVAVTSGGGPVTAGIFVGAILGKASDSGDTAINDGTIEYDSFYTGGYADIEFNTGTVQNGWDGTTAATITGNAAGVYLVTSGLVQNAGTITAGSATGDGVYLGAGTVDNGTATAVTALISGGARGVLITGAGTVVNDGTIIGLSADGVYIGSGSVTNGTSLDTTARISGGGAYYGIWVGTGSGVVSNFGTIFSTGAAGAYLEAGGTLTNGSTGDTAALLSGSAEGVLVGQPGSADSGTIFNYATIKATTSTAGSGFGVFLEDGGAVTNFGSLSSISGLSDGVVVEGAGGTVQNAGSIGATDVTGVGVGVALTAGGNVTNGLAAGATATIQGSSDGVQIAAGGSAVVQNFGTIIGYVAVDFLGGPTQATGTLYNDGLIESTGGVNAYAVEFGTGSELLVLQSGGSFVGGILGNDSGGASTTLEFAAGTTGTLTNLQTDSANVTDSAGNFFYNSIDTLTVDAGASWTASAPGTALTVNVAGNLFISGGTISVLGTLTNSGSVTVSSGNLTVYGDLADYGVTAGVVAMTAGTGVTLEANVASAQTLEFGSGVETLGFAAPLSVHGTIEGFAAGSTIDLINTSVTGFNYAGTILDVMDNTVVVAALNLPGAFTSGSFLHNSDFAGGTLITLAPPCFVTGTRIRTDQGDVAVENLRVGDMVRTHAGQLRPIVWIGRRSVACAVYPRPRDVMPVRVRANAFADGQPYRDLCLSPEHAVFAEGVLIPIHCLQNGISIVQENVETIDYWHVELPSHDILLAEGLPCESFLDNGDRESFETGLHAAPLPEMA